MQIEFPLSVAISALINNNKILLIKRVKDGFEGCWSLPGGKIKKDEHVSDAAVREIFEETGIQARFKDHLGFVSEHQVYADDLKHVILHVCHLESDDYTEIQSDEGELGWFDLDNIHEVKSSLIPSDYLMIKKMIKSKEKSYYNCVIEIDGDSHILKKFE